MLHLPGSIFLIDYPIEVLGVFDLFDQHFFTFLREMQLCQLVEVLLFNGADLA